MKTEKGISRRNFLKCTAVGAVGVATIGVLGACGKDPAPTTAVPDASTKKIASGDGKYLTKAMGHEDYIYVSTTFKDGAIAECSVVSHNETIGIGNFACARIPAAIVASQSIKVPNVRGCSISSAAIKAAVKEAIELAGYKVDDFSKEVPEPDNNTEETINTDVVIVGAGTAGLVCASKLLDQGYKVAVIEKHAIPGGSMAMTYSGVVAVGSKDIQNYNVDGKVPDYFLKLDSYMGLLQGYLDPAKDRFNKKMPYETQAYGGCTKLVDYFTSIGIGFCALGNYESQTTYGTTHFLAPGAYMGGAGYAMMALADRIARHPNGKIYYMTKCSGSSRALPAHR